MNIISYLDWFTSLKSKEVFLTESISNWFEKVCIDKDENGFTTKIPFKNSTVLFNKNTNFYIRDNDVIIRLKHNRISNSINLFDNRVLQSYIFETENFDENSEQFFQYFSKIESKFFIADFLNIVNGELVYTINGTNFKISTSELALNFKGVFLCIEADTKISFKEFKHCVNSIILSIGFFSGFLYKKEEYFFQSEDNEFLNVNFFYRSQNKRLFTYEPFTKFSQNYTDDETGKFSSSITVEQFSKLTNLIYENPKYYSSIQMLFGNNKDSFIVEHSVLMVVLETIALEVRNEFNPEHVQKVFVKKEAFEVLKSVEDKISIHDFEILKNAIETIDVAKAKNIVDFELAFSVLKINLSNNDRKSLKRRNSIFHGRILSDFEIINSEENFTELEEVYKFHSYKLYVLICKLILKQIDFDGYLLNYPKILCNNLELIKSEPYFVKI